MPNTDPNHILNVLSDKQDAFEQMGSPKDLAPEMQRFALDGYERLYKQGFFAQGDGQVVGHNLRKQYSIHDDTQGKPAYYGVTNGVPEIDDSPGGQQAKDHLLSQGKPFFEKNVYGYSAFHPDRTVAGTDKTIRYFDPSGKSLTQQQYTKSISAEGMKGHLSGPIDNTTSTAQSPKPTTLDPLTNGYEINPDTDPTRIPHWANLAFGSHPALTRPDMLARQPQGNPVIEKAMRLSVPYTGGKFNAPEAKFLLDTKRIGDIPEEYQQALEDTNTLASDHILKGIGKGIDYVAGNDINSDLKHQWLATHDKWLPKTVQKAIADTNGPMETILPSIGRIATGMLPTAGKVSQVSANFAMSGDTDQFLNDINDMAGGTSGASSETAQALIRLGQHNPVEAKRLMGDVIGKIASGVITDPALYIVGAKYIGDDFYKPITEAVTIRRATTLRTQQLEAVGKGDFAHATELGVQAARYEKSANSMTAEREGQEGAYGKGPHSSVISSSLDAARARLETVSNGATSAWKSLAERTPGSSLHGGGALETLPKDPAAGLEEFATTGLGGLGTDNSPSGMLSAPEMRELIKQNAPHLHAQMSEGVGSPEPSASLNSLAVHPELLDMLGERGYAGDAPPGETPATLTSHAPLGTPDAGGVGLSDLEAVRSRMRGQVMPGENELGHTVDSNVHVATHDPLTGNRTGIEDKANPLLKQGEGLGGPVEAVDKNYPTDREAGLVGTPSEIDAVRARIKAMSQQHEVDHLQSGPLPKPDWAPKPDVPTGWRGYDEWENKANSGTSPAEVARSIQEADGPTSPVGKAYREMQDNPNKADVRKAYGALAREVKKQYMYAVKRLGIEFEPWTKEGTPYANAVQAAKDVRDNKHLYYVTEQAADGHPLSKLDPTTGVHLNDMLSATHALFGHTGQGGVFDWGNGEGASIPRGSSKSGTVEAYNRHGSTFSPEARKAYATEVRGRREAGPGTPMKAGLLPDEFHGREDKPSGQLPKSGASEQPSQQAGTTAGGANAETGNATGEHGGDTPTPEERKWFGPDGEVHKTLKRLYTEEEGHFSPQDLVLGVRKTFTNLSDYLNPGKDKAGDWFPGINATSAEKSIMGKYHAGARDEYTSMAHKGAAFKKLMDDMPAVFKLQFYKDFEAGKPQGDPFFQEVADFATSVNKYLDDERHRVNPDAAALDNYFHHNWEVLPGSDGKRVGNNSHGTAGRRPLSGDTGFNKQRVYATYEAGIAAGGVPKSLNPLVNLEDNFYNTKKWVALKDMYKDAMAQGRAHYIDGDSSRDVVTSLDKAGNEQKWYAVHDDSSRVFGTLPNGDLYTKGRIYTSKGLADMINNHLSEDKIMSNPIGRSLVWLKNMTTQWELIGPAFHLLNETTESIGSQVGSAMHAFKNGRFKDGLNELKGNPLKKVQEGNLWREYQRQGEQDFGAGNRDTWLKTDPKGQKLLAMYKNAPEIFSLLTDAGLKWGTPEEMQMNAYRNMKDGLESVMPSRKVAGVLNIPAVILEHSGKWLFDETIPQLKWAAAAKEMAASLSDYGVQLGERPDSTGTVRAPKLTRDQLAQRVVSSIDSRFGEVNWERLHLPRTVATASQLAFRASGWFLGNLTAPSLALRYTWEDMVHNAEAGDPVIAGKGGEGGIQRNPQLAWMIGTALFGVVANSMVQHAMTGLAPGQKTKKDEPWSDWRLATKDIVFPRINKDDLHERISPPGMTKDIGQVAVGVSDMATGHGTGDLQQYGKNKMASIFPATYEAINNKDYKGTPITDHPDTAAGKAELFAHLFGKPIGGASSGIGGLGGMIGGRLGPVGGAVGTVGGAAVGAHFFPTEEQQAMPEGRRMMHTLYTGKPPASLVNDPFERFIQQVRAEQGGPQKTKAQDEKYKQQSALAKQMSPDQGERSKQLIEWRNQGKIDQTQAEKMITMDTTAPWQVAAVKGIPLDKIPEAWGLADKDEKAKIKNILIERIYTDKNIKKILADPDLHRKLVLDKLMVK